MNVELIQGTALQVKSQVNKARRRATYGAKNKG